ncbi:phosphatase PAP2 family protein [Aquicoccus sp. G2-2]|uniref:phosphatase PAP2 family protein n=1 Tax=Aquicoccus sp. G2-2 TaxID=3092120 RepID=UPI002AE057FC|nr:phosphatase PAP2 family protein [Aquicoccus sp. G2-2]MEA1115047.1 phosphatase PAP2 family protein [Aquicoccus sp. G2-2]
MTWQGRQQMRGWLENQRLFWLLRRHRAAIVVVVLILVLLVTPPLSRRYGDRLQIALPLLGLGCSVLTGGTGEYLTRFVVMETILQGTKRGLGDAPINVRPDGNLKGFPSGHSTAAAFGASALVHECLRASPPVQAAVIIAAGFTGASRIAAERHDIWQVLAGILLGYLTERLFRRRRRGFLRWIKAGVSRYVQK